MDGPIARLSWELYVDCPHCGATFDAVTVDHENSIARRVFTNAWDDVKGVEIECPKCDKEFELGVIEY